MPKNGHQRPSVRGSSMPPTIEIITMRRVFARLIPLLFAMMFFNYLDRINIGFAAFR